MPKSKLDRIDLELLNLLQTQGNMTIKDLSAKVGLSAGPLHRRLKILEKNDIIKGYRALFNLARIGYDQLAFLEVTLKSGENSDGKFDEQITKVNNIIEAYRIEKSLALSGSRYLLKVALRHEEDATDWVAKNISQNGTVATVQVLPVEQVIDDSGFFSLREFYNRRVPLKK
ncbi:MAG: Lrp/AsnC family transcriptional regulator [Bacteroidia bacterium]